MRRREFITAIATTAAAWPFAARAQQGGQKLRRIGHLIGGTQAGTSRVSVGLIEGLRELGYIEGRDYIVEYRYAEGHYDRFPDLAAELVRLNVDVVVLGTPAAISAMRKATSTIPIIMAVVSDPVGNGFVSSLARPGGNITGLATSDEITIAKQIELLSEILPKLSRVGILVNPDSPTVRNLVTARAAARQAAIELWQANARNADEIDAAFVKFSQERVQAAIVIPDAVFALHRRRIAELAMKDRLPTMFANREYVVDGGTLSYGQDIKYFLRRSAVLVDKIFKGAKPADLPIEQPTRFFLTVNLKTAKAIGLDLPESFLLRADEVIE
ncbi:ABC transporter substrate-binding protein [Bradyrhizobium sp. SRL28]|uniref:ABC transporter substrate-binding protein n=1 Tax=Bradyrhizobium sp. SRL28 TaxID=2836178 RepID=UPI001BDE090B|nr:ABC transporter substrate-binding protein [Bradyrhizobium sp. SRL28]MBT1515771.1 ABC transporter substrate-binding protein [Bradyrhizobium sp. SRL28]